MLPAHGLGSCRGVSSRYTPSNADQFVAVPEQCSHPHSSSMRRGSSPVVAG
jgi:hypothetical protein